MDNLNLELERVIAPKGAKDHSQLQNLDYENSGHTGFASLEQLNATNEKVSTLEEQVQTNASAIQALSEGIDPEKIDGIKDLINYVEEHEVDVVSIQEGIEQNAKDIDTLEEKVTALEESGSSTPSGEPLVATFKIDSANTSVTVKNLTGATMVDWGDGNAIEDISQMSEYNHTYTQSGRYDAMFYGLTQMGSSCFENQTQLERVSIPPIITSIGQKAFSRCSNLLTVELPISVIQIGENAFYNCYTLRNINLNNIVSFGTNSFSWCGSLYYVAVDRESSLSGQAFSNCANLKRVQFNNQTSLLGKVFQNCSKLETVTILGTKSYTSLGDDFPTTTKIIVPYEQLEAYKSDEKWSKIASQIDAYAMASDIGNINTQLANIIEGEGV